MLRSVITIIAAIFISEIAVAPALAERKIAFVVGIDKYDNLGPQQQLQRAVNDARSVAGALASLGFEVVRAENVGRGAFNAEWQKFLDKVQPGDTTALYYSGHGVEIEGLNFLLPRDLPNISYGRQEQLKRESLSVSELLLDLRRRKPQVTLVILDACRDHPLTPPENKSFAWGGGLARMDAPAGTFIMYSAGAGQTALDRLPGDDPDKVNSIYTRKLLPLVKTPGLPLPELARQLRLEVNDLAAVVPHVQQPAYYDGLIGKFCLAGCEVVVGGPAVKVPPAAAIKSTPTVMQTPTRCDGVEAQVGNENRCLKAKDSFKDCPDCPAMVVVPSGSFSMGSPQNEPDRWSGEAQVRVLIAAPFAVGQFAVTFDEWDYCLADGGCDSYRADDRGWGRGNRPVIDVSWVNAKAYAKWLSRTTGKTYRLLSEAEREYVTRAGTTTTFWWGPSITPKQANYKGIATYEGGGFAGEFRLRTVPVDSFEPNQWGLFNVHGNVWEWTEDCWNESNAGNPGNGDARIVGNCSRRVLRGGSWLDAPQLLRAAFRYEYLTIFRSYVTGFRVARTLNP